MVADLILKSRAYLRQLDNVYSFGLQGSKLYGKNFNLIIQEHLEILSIKQRNAKYNLEVE